MQQVNFDECRFLTSQIFCGVFYLQTFVAVILFINHIMKVVIIGSGNVANVLGKKIVERKHIVVQVCGRNKSMVEKLAKQLFAKGECNFKKIEEADIYIIAVSDAAVAEVALQLKLKNKLIVHTAGAVSKNVLKNVSEDYGAFYPLQSLRKELNYIPEMPLLVDGNNKEATEKIIAFAKTISQNVVEMDDEKRLKFHAAAVVVSNFTNHLFAITKDFCDTENLDFKILYPLIKETFLRVENNAPSETQTGPAFRRDIETMQKHLNIFKDFPELKKMYEIMSESILQKYR